MTHPACTFPLFLAAVLLAALLPGTALAGGEATVHVEVVRGTRGAQGIDEKVARHERLLSSIEGFGGWQRADLFAIDVELGQEESRKVGDRAFAAKLDELSAERAVVTLRVYDPKGREHKVVSRFGKGAQTAVRTESADGQESWVFVVTLTF